MDPLLLFSLNIRQKKYLQVSHFICVFHFLLQLPYRLAKFVTILVSLYVIFATYVGLYSLQYPHLVVCCHTSAYLTPDLT